MIYAALATIKELHAQEYAQMIHDPVNHPKHYTEHPSGVECIQITEHMGFNLGNAVKYIWRADLKGNSIQDLEKAVWYVQREIQLRTSPAAKTYSEAGSITASPART